METKKKATNKTGTKPVHTIRKGAIAANIWQRQSQTGYSYFEYSLSRSYKSLSTDKEGYSNNFFPRNEQSLIEVVQAASSWISDQSPDEATSEAA